MKSTEDSLDRMGDTLPRYVPLVLTTIGCVLLMGSYLWFYSTKQFIEQSILTTGTVVALVEEYVPDPVDPPGTLNYYPVVEFITSNNEIIRFKSSTGSSWSRPRIGQ